MFTDTDETKGLEEWNVNTIAHLESETPEGISALWDGSASASISYDHQPLAAARLPGFNFCVAIQ